MSAIRFTNPDHWNTLEGHLVGGDHERYAFAFTRPLSAGDEVVVEVVDVVLIPDDEVQLHRLAGEAMDRVHNDAIKGGLGVVEFHRHPAGPPRFSGTDEDGLAPMASYVTGILPGRAYGAGVLADGRVRVDHWQSRHGSVERSTFDSVTVLGDHYRILNAPKTSAPTFDRQLDLVTAQGQDALAVMRVALVGAGGTGSHMGVGLAYLGFRDVVVYDGDRIELSNLNRTVTADPSDLGAPKALVAQRRMREIAPGMRVETRPPITPATPKANLADFDLIIGCVDHDGVRDYLNDVAVTTATPYLDIATGVDTKVTPPAVGGHVVLVRPGHPCLHCHDLLDPAEVGSWTKPPDQQILDYQHGYGTGVPNPSVVYLNAMASYAGLAEIAAWVSGHRPPAQFLQVDLNSSLAKRGTPPGSRIVVNTPTGAVSTCFACARP